MLVAPDSFQLFLKAFILSFAYTGVVFLSIILVIILCNRPERLAKIGIIMEMAREEEEEEEEEENPRRIFFHRPDIENGLRTRLSHR